MLNNRNPMVQPRQLDLSLSGSVEIDSIEDHTSDQTLNQILTSPRNTKIIETPYSMDISAGKNSYVYDAHTYHTKVPPQGIEPLIEYYTNPGDIVLDPFCGSGMTGVAALEKARQVILSDLSPAAAFIAQNLCTPIDDTEFLEAVHRILDESQDVERKLYSTECRHCGKQTFLLYMVWSYGLLCSKCGTEFILWDVARDERETVKESKIKSVFKCPHCREDISKRNLKRTKRYPVQVGYRCCTKRNKEQTAVPSNLDLAVLKYIDQEGLPQDLWFPTDRFPLGVNTRQPIAAGIDTVDKAYTPRALWAMAYLWQKASTHSDSSIRNKLLFTLTSLYQRVTVFSEFRFWGGSGNTANYNVPHIMNEQNVFTTFLRKAKTISWYFRQAPSSLRRLHVSVRSACNLNHIPDESIDFVFTDPPFGSNINYSEMNFLWESWLRTHTDNTEEAIVSSFQQKSFDDYRVLLCRSFLEANRVLKPNSWMCVVFHNSSDKVWNSLQRAIIDAGFEVKGAQTFDKQHGTFKMFVSDNAVGYDLVLHCKKVSSTNAHGVLLEKSSTDKVREFIGKQLEKSGKYAFRYLHVSRRAEFDYRRLYAEWLCSSFPQSEISIDFEGFRRIVDNVRADRNDD